MMPANRPCRVLALTALLAGLSLPRLARAETQASSSNGSLGDGVYDRFDGDLDLGLALGAEFGSAGQVAPTLRGTAHYFSIAGLYASTRVHAGIKSAPSLFGLGVDLRPLFVPRWAKGLETGPGFLDLTLDSLSLSLGAFWAEPRGAGSTGLDAELGFGVPLWATARGPWLEARGALRYPDFRDREGALIVALAWHGFLTTPFTSR